MLHLTHSSAASTGSGVLSTQVAQLQQQHLHLQQETLAAKAEQQELLGHLAQFRSAYAALSQHNRELNHKVEALKVRLGKSQQLKSAPQLQQESLPQRVRQAARLHPVWPCHLPCMCTPRPGISFRRSRGSLACRGAWLRTKPASEAGQKPLLV